jgi:tetratricopeptide (TPR) repeat protein
MPMSQPETFIERKRETEIFLDWLQKTGSQQPRTLFLHSKPGLDKQGGLGKTSLLRRFCDIAGQQEEHTVIMIDFLTVHDRSGETIAKCIVNELSKKYTDWNTHSFHLALSEYMESLRDDGQAAQRGGEDLRRNLRIALQQCLQLLIPRFAETHGRLIIFFDTFEIIGQDFSSVMLQNDLPFPDTYDFPYIDFVIAGRAAPEREDVNWSGRWDHMQLLSVQPFSREEMLQYYHQQLSMQEYEQVFTHIDRVEELTQGRPIQISLIADLFTAAIFVSKFSFTDLLTAAPNDFEERLVRSFGDVERPDNFVVLAMAHVHHRFNRAIFTLILRTIFPGDSYVEYLETWPALLELSFVRQASDSDDITLHDEMRELINKYNWSKLSPLMRSELSSKVIRYYEQEIEDSQERPVIHQNYVVEQLYHRFFVDCEDGWRTFETLFRKAIQKWQLGYARNLLREACRPEIQALLSPEQRADLEVNEIVLLRKEERYQEALERCEQFRACVGKTWLEKHTEKLLFELGECYRGVYRFDDALIQFQRIVQIASISITPSDYLTEALSRIGSIHEQLADFDNATRCYEESLHLFKQENRRGRYVDALNHLCQVHCYENNFDAALRNCLIALSICRETDGISPVMHIDSLSTAGMVHIYRRNFATALRYITEAQDEAERLRHKQRIARIYAIRGDLELAKENYAGAKLWFAKAYRTSLFISKDIEIRSLYKQAQADVYLQKWANARDSLEKVRDLAAAIKNHYWETAAQLMLVDVLRNHGKDLEAEQLYQQMRREAESKHLKSYSRLFGDMERKLALKYYSERKYREAFESFGRFCEYLAQCTPKEFTAGVDETAKYLLELEAQEISDLFDLFKQYCQKSMGRYVAQADQQEVAQILQEIQDIVDFYRVDSSQGNLYQSDSDDDAPEGTSSTD